MSSQTHKVKNALPIHRSLFNSFSIDDFKLCVPIRKYKFKPGYGGLLSNKINPIVHNKLTLYEKMLACSVVRDSSNLKELILNCGKIANLDLRYQVCRSFSALEFWEKTPGRKIDMFRNVICDNIMEGAPYSKYIKEVFQEGIRAYFWQKKKVVVQGKEHLVDNYNYTPPLQYLILFKVEFDDMRECMFIPSKKISKEIEEEIRAALEPMLPEELEYVRPESLFSIKTTGCSDVNLMPSKHFVQSSKSKVTYTHKFRARRERIQISPENERDIGVCDLPTYYTVRMLDEYILQILKGLESSAIGSRNLEYKIQKFFKKTNRSGFFYHRDYKKSALTFSHELLKVIRKILIEKYPDIKDLEYLDVYLDQEIKDGDEILRPKRGFPLGMANNLYTLVSIIATQILRTRLPEEIELEFLAGNDDSTTHVHVVDDAMSYSQAYHDVFQGDLEVHEDLDLILNEKKIFCAFDTVFFEEYSHADFKNKESLFYSGIGAIRLCETIAEAKEHCNNILSYAKFDCTELVNYMTEWFGWEFFPQECNFDYSLGGWYSGRYRDGLSTILNVAEDDLYQLSQGIFGVKEHRVLLQDEMYTTSHGKISERWGIRPTKLFYKKDDFIRNFLLADSNIVNRGAKMMKHTNSIQQKYRTIQRLRLRVKGTTKRHELFKYYLKAYRGHDIPIECVDKTTIFYDSEALPDNVDDFLNCSDLLGQYLLAKAIEGDIEITGRSSDYVSKYNSKKLECMLKKRYNLEPTECNHIFYDRVKINGVYNMIRREEKTLIPVIHEPRDMGFEIPYALDDVANNPINRFVARYREFPVSYKEIYRELFVEEKLENTYLTLEDSKLIDSLEESEFVDATKLWHCLNDKTNIHACIRTLEWWARVRKAETTEEEKLKSIAYVCGIHASGHEFEWENKDTYPIQKGLDLKCFYCDLYNTWYMGVKAEKKKFSVEEGTSLQNIVQQFKQLLPDDIEPPLSWFMPETGWGLLDYEEPQDEEEQVVDEEQPQDDEEVADEDGEIEEIDDEEVVDEDYMPEDEEQ